MNWQVKSNSLGFSRGTVGFFAMGELDNVEFNTNLPDGDYCDIIQDCNRKISVVNGMANFTKLIEDEPIVAICVGCN